MPNSFYKAGAQTEELEEKGFNLPLPTLVEGVDTKGKPFEETTVLTYISAVGSSFWVDSDVALYSDMRLTIDLPQNLSDGKNLKLVVKGKVTFIEEPRTKKEKNRVSLKFENRYIIEPKD
jgi:hypothetical protein